MNDLWTMMDMHDSGQENTIISGLFMTSRPTNQQQHPTTDDLLLH